MSNPNPAKNFEDLVTLMARLRAPDGCPWDREQTYATLAPMLIEEAYEVIEAAEAEDWSGLRDELGDLLFQIVFYGQIAKDSEHFDIQASIARVHEKMVRRHPHIFGAEKVDSVADVLVNWEAIKAEERQAAGKTNDKPASLLDGVSHKLPALLEAYQLTIKAARVGFDWRDAAHVFDKIDEEMNELRVEIERGERDEKALADELGDLLFVATNLARKLNLEPERALKGANRKFRRRFGFIETQLAAQGRSCGEASLEEMDALWNEAKQAERKS